MPLLKYAPFPLCLFFILGILFGYNTNTSITTAVVVISALFSILIIVHFIAMKRLQRNSAFAIIALFLFFFIGHLVITAHKGQNQHNHYTKFDWKNPVTLKITSILNPSTYYNKYGAEVSFIGETVTQGKIILNVKIDSLNTRFDVDDVIITKAEFKEITAPKNPYQFNYKDYLAKQNIQHQITVLPNTILRKRPDSHSVRGLAHKLRIKALNQLQLSGFKGDEFAIISSLLLGQRQELSKELKEEYINAGAMHILAISGLHIGIIILFLTFIFKPLLLFKQGRTLRMILIILLLWMFAFIAGLSPSVVRAVTMFTAVSFALLGRRRRNVYHTLFFSLFILLIAHPFFLFDVGFQLSYIAVFSIVTFQPLLERLFAPKAKILSYLWKLFTVSLAAQIGILPVSLYYFHQFPGLFFLTNLVIIPVLGFILCFGIIVVLISSVGTIPNIIFKIYNTIIEYMNDFIAWVAKQEAFLFENIHFPLSMFIFTYILIFCCYRFLRDFHFKNLRLALIAVFVLQIVLIFEKWQENSKIETTIFNKTRSTLVANRVGESLEVFSNDITSANDYTIKSYLQNSRIKNVSFKTHINPLDFYEHDLLVIDSLGIYKINGLNPKKILLTYSPKINLDRLIVLLKPQIIIADNSNYTSYVRQWSITCEKYNIPFHYTSTLGSVNLSLNTK